MDILTPQHPLWEEFVICLEAALDQYGCDDMPERPLTRTILTDLAQIADIDVDATLDWYDDLDGYCDCEVLYHVVGKYEMLMTWHRDN
jgi:hypothetical protein